MYSKNIVASYTDFVDYWESMKDEPNIGVLSVVVGDIEDAQTFQKNAIEAIYPLLFVHVPSFESFNSGGNMNRFDSDFLVLMQNDDDRNARSGIYNQTREIVLNIQKRMERDAQNGLFDFDGRLQAEPKANATMGKCYGWFVSFEMATPGVGVDSDYRD
jgi:hypothetical protein